MKRGVVALSLLSNAITCTPQVVLQALTSVHRVNNYSSVFEDYRLRFGMVLV